jgi:hypothetical protein
MGPEVTRYTHTHDTKTSSKTILHTHKYTIHTSKQRAACAFHGYLLTWHGSRGASQGVGIWKRERGRSAPRRTATPSLTPGPRRSATRSMSSCLPAPVPHGSCGRASRDPAAWVCLAVRGGGSFCEIRRHPRQLFVAAQYTTQHSLNTHIACLQRAGKGSKYSR